MKNIYVKDLIGENMEEEFLEFNLTEVQKVLLKLQYTDAVDLPHAEVLQQQALRGADVLSEHLSKLVKTVSYLESKVNSARNKASLEYKSPDGSKITLEMRKWAGDISPEVEEIQIKLAKAKGSKVLLEKKHDLLIKSYYYYKEIAGGLRKTILGYVPTSSQESPVPEGWE
jgi:hypothetical protein